MVSVGLFGEFAGVVSTFGAGTGDIETFCITKRYSLCEPRRFFSARRHDTANETTEVKRKLTASIQKS